MKVSYNITQNKFNATLNQETTEIKVKFQTGYYPLPVGLENYYTKNETDLLLENYYLKTETYSQEEINDFLGLKADSSQLNDYYTKSETYSQNQINTYLSTKLDKGGYTGNAQDLKNDINNLRWADIEQEELISGLRGELDTEKGRNDTQDSRLENLEGENASQNDLISDLFSELQSEKTRNDIQDSELNNLNGIYYTWSPTNRTLTLFDRGGNQLSQVSLVSLDNEGTDIRYNASTLSLELYNADNELLDSIPVSSFIGSVGTQLQLNSNQLQLKDSQGNVLSTVSFEISNINGLQTILNNKLDKGTYTGNAQDLKNEIDGKLNKPTTTSNTTSYPYVVGENGNGGSARLPAGDLGKNFFNSDLSNTTARNHTMNAGVTVNTLGNPHTLSGLPNKNTDISNFRKVRVQNTSGLDSVVDSKNLLTDGVTSMSDAEKDAWRTAQRKTGEAYSTGQPRVDLISPPLIETAKNYIQYVSIIGSNLFINNSISSNSIVTLQRFKDVNNIVLITPDPEINITNKVTVIQSLPNTFYIAENFSNYSEGYYRIKITNNGLTNIINDSINLLIKYNFVSESFNNFSIDSNTTNPNISYNINGNNSIEIVSSNASQFGAVKLNKLLDINPNVGLYLKGVFSIRGVANGAMTQLVKVGFGDNQPINNNPLLKTFFQVDGVSNLISINGASYISLPYGTINNYEFYWIIKNGTATISFPNVPSLKVTVPINNITELYLYISLSSLSIPSQSQQYISFSITDIKTI